MSIIDRSSFFRRIFPGLLTGLVMMLSGGAHAQTALSLKDCINQGLKNHPELQIANNNIESSKQAAREALGAYLPQVNVNGEFDNNLKLQTNVIPASPPLFPKETKITFGNKYATTLTAQAEQQIFNEPLLIGLKASKPNTQIAKLNAEQDRQTLIYNIASAYFQVMTAQKQQQLLDSNQAQTQRLLKITSLQSQMGVARKVDVKQIQVKLNNLNSQISLATNNVELAKNNLKNAMGMYDDSQIELADTSRWLSQTPTPTKTEFQGNNTITYLLLNNQIQLYGINAKSILARGIPSLSAFARYGLNGFGKQFDNVFQNQYGFSTVGLKLSWNVFNGFTRGAQYQEAMIQMRNAQLNQKITLANTSLQYANAQSQLLQAQNMLSTNKDNVALASDVYNIATLSYREGTGSLSDLLNAESSYLDAENNYIQSLIKYYLAQLDTARINNNLENYFNQL